MLTGTCHCGATGWTMTGEPGPVTACNCTLCRRYGGLWAYGFEGEHITFTGATRAYVRADAGDPHLAMLFCPTCAGVLGWRGLKVRDDGRRRMAVNVRLAPPDAVAHLAVDHFDGLDTFEDLPPKGLRVRDVWF